MMPIMGGLEMARQLRKNTLTSTIPIILLTAKSDKQTEHDSLAAGIDAFISKPFDLDFLKMQINQLITRKERLSEQLRLDEISKPRVEAIESTDERLLVKVTQVIEAHIDDSDFTVQKLSENAGIGVKQLYRKIKQLTALTPVEYIRSIRMKKAAILLRQKKFTIAEVMYMVGYSNASYFSKCFQSEFGVTPKVFVERDA
jgi:AraC-like DNA-binding protein